LFPLLTEGGGTVDWKKTMALLHSRDGQYPLVLELKEVAELSNPLEQVNRVFEELESQ